MRCCVQFVKEDSVDVEAAALHIYTDLVASIRPTIDSIYDAFSDDEGLFNNDFWVCNNLPVD